MYSDGLTKGAVSRELLHMAMQGDMPFKHEYEQWRSKLSTVGGSQRTEVCEVSGSQQTETHLRLFTNSNTNLGDSVSSVSTFFTLQLPPTTTCSPLLPLLPTTHPTNQLNISLSIAIHAQAVALSSLQRPASCASWPPQTLEHSPAAMAASAMQSHAPNMISDADLDTTGGSQQTEPVVENEFEAQWEEIKEYVPVPGFPEIMWPRGHEQPTTLYRHHGHIYRTKHKPDPELNGQLAVDVVQNYA